jgi:hypothetical protein
LLNAKVKELKAKENNMKRMVSIDSYNKLKSHLQVLIKKHQTFRDMILTSDGENFDANSFSKLQHQLKNMSSFNVLLSGGPSMFNLYETNENFYQKSSNQFSKESDLVISDLNSKTQMQLVAFYL